MKYLNKLYWKIRIIGFSIPWIFCINLDDRVKYDDIIRTFTPDKVFYKNIKVEEVK